MAKVFALPPITPGQFKRSTDADDTASFLRAFDYFRVAGAGHQAGGTLYCPGGYTISDTLLISSVGITLQGDGWGNSLHPTSGTWIRWNGPAGIPMVKILQTFNAGLCNLRLIGKSSAKPSCAIQYADEGTDSFMGSFLSRVWIGDSFGYDTDEGVQFHDGIIATGTINGDSNSFTQIVIHSFDGIGFDIQNGNFSGNDCSGLYIYGYQAPNTIGMRVKQATISGTNWYFGQCKDTCFRFMNGARIQITDWNGEGNNRLATFDDACVQAKFYLRGGAFQCQTGLLAADGRYIDTGNANGWDIDLDGFSQQIADLGVPVPKIRAYNVSGGLTQGRIRLRTRGIYPANLEFGSYGWSNDDRDILYQPMTEAGANPLPVQTWKGNYTDPVDRSFRAFASDSMGEFKQRGGPFIVKKLDVPPAPTAVAQTGSGSTTYSYKVTAITYDGETEPTAAVTCTNAAVLGASNINRISWHPVHGANAYKIYGRTAGSWLLLKTLTWDELHTGVGTTGAPSWDDNGSVTPAGAISTVNTTGNLGVEGRIMLGTTAAPPTPANGDMWFDGTALKIRIGGVTKTVTVT
jgi:hypothetical protein